MERGLMTFPGRLYLIVLITFLFPLLGCGGGSMDRQWTGTVDTLPSGLVRVVNPAMGLWELAEPWRLVPELVLGEIDGAEEVVFAAIIGLEVDAAGRIYVLDRQVNELRVFSPDGTHLWSVGRQGGGPNEYSNANGLEWMAPDTLLIIDQRGNRYTVLTKDGEYVRSVPRQLPFYGWMFRGGYWDGKIYEHYYVGSEEDRHPALFGTSLLDGSSVPDSVPPGDVSSHLPGDTIMLPEPEAPPAESFSVRTDRGGMVFGVPFTPSSVYHLDREGRIWHGHGSEPRIFLSSLSGDTISEFVIQTAPYPVTGEELAEWEAGDAVQRFREMGGVLDMGRIPDTKPYFDDLYLDPDGYLWLSVPGGPGETVFGVIDPDGRYLGELRVDGIERDAFVQPVVRNDRLYFIGRDELDVQRVYGFRIER